MTALAEQIRQGALEPARMAAAIEAMMAGQMSAEEIGVFLRALAKRGETAEELIAAAQVLRTHAVPLPFSKPLELCDTCGTGGDGRGTWNISTAAALVAAAAGVRIAKHGNRAASSACGSADVLSALGLDLEAPPERVAASIEAIGFGFCYAPLFHPAMKAVAPVRKALGIRTIFNLIGPLANPATLTSQLVGVAEARYLEPMAHALQALGIRHGMVVHGRDGLDEVSTVAETDAIEVQDGTLKRLQIHPEEYRIQRASPEDLEGSHPERNALIMRRVLGGRASPQRDVVVLNAGCVIYVANQARDIRDGVAKAQAVLESGRTLKLLDQVIERSHA